MDIMNEKTVKQVEKLAEEKISILIRSSIETAQNDMESDIFGFREVFHHAAPKAWT
ncbi:spore germination protein KC [Alteribacillus bidgolensis]|uniref:Spore germination protein KC n=1 Tax=Alteribacillus bidgolensis TaxID=930129 RepID=A0A1G8NPB2_9BACI|nr:spore germination protein KC [Alteribacillus bidgolensis]